MKKLSLLLIRYLVSCVLYLVSIFVYSQNYNISFAGSGASTKVDSVNVENLTQCKSLSLSSGSDILNLNVTNAINEISNSTDNFLRIYPNPMTDYCLFDFEATAQGETTLSLYDIAGKRISQVQEFLIKGNHTYSISGTGSGIYVLKVESAQYSYSAKIVSCIAYSVSGNAVIKNKTQVSSIKTQDIDSNTEVMKSLKSNKSLINMQYTPNDILKLTGFSGIYSTVFMLVPDSSQIVTFNFIACTDGDNNNYAIVQIGTQTWMEENLKTTKYNDGTSTPLIIDNNAWISLSTPAYCWYNDSIKYKDIYGGLYNWFAVDTGKLCPLGWHIPTDSEWSILLNYLGGDSIAGGKMKEACSTHWLSPNPGATNSSGFTALPGGNRISQIGSFLGLGYNSYWWSATEKCTGAGYECVIFFDETAAYSQEYDDQTNGFSVRCIKD